MNKPIPLKLGLLAALTLGGCGMIGGEESTGGTTPLEASQLDDAAQTVEERRELAEDGAKG